MRKISTVIICCLFFTAFSFSQNVVSMTYINSKTKAEVAAIFGLSIFKSGVDYYKMTYTSTDAKGNADTLSGLAVIPNVVGATYPILMYEHGTSGCKTCVPSRYEQTGGDEGEVGVLFSAMGYVALLPDYVGMGDGRGFQTYVHEATTVSATEDMLEAFRTWAPSNNILINNQLFITGYSQGGYASMAFHKYMQATHGATAVTAATHNSGPYSLSGVMRDLIIKDSAYNYPAYIPNTILGMNEVYGMYTSLNEFFKDPYTADITAYYTGAISLTTLNTRLIDSLMAHNGNYIANNMIQDSVFNSFENDLNHPLNKKLRENDVYRWVPQSPTRIFYCEADDQVPYKNAIVAIDTMYNMGADASLVQAISLGTSYDHSQCVSPAFYQTILFFSNYQSTTLETTNENLSSLSVYPNPANNMIHFKGEGWQKAIVTLFDSNGKKVLQQNVYSNTGIDVSFLDKGIYFLEIKSKGSETMHKKLIIE